MPVNLNYEKQPFRCNIRTSPYHSKNYEETECLGVDVFFSALKDNGLGRYDNDNLPFGDGFYDFIEQKLSMGVALVDRQGKTHGAKAIYQMHNYRLNDNIDDHLRINYGKGIMSNAWRFDIWCNSDRNFRFSGVDFSVIPRRARSTLHAKGERTK